MKIWYTGRVSPLLADISVNKSVISATFTCVAWLFVLSEYEVMHSDIYSLMKIESMLQDYW